MHLKDRIRRCGLYSPDLEKGPMVGPCEDGNEP
jgi:hypothetical protein